MVRRAVALLLFALSLTFGAMGYQAYAATAPVSKMDEDVVLPLLSPRRVPELSGDLTQEAILRDAVRSATQEMPAGSKCLVIQRNGRPVYTDDPNTAFTPASTVKLLTAAAALDAFGSDHTFTTRVVAQKKPKDGVLEGSLYFVGGGDPLLLTDDYVAAWSGHRDIHSSLERLADDIVTSGINTIEGGVVGDDARFDDVRYVSTWDDGYRTGGQSGPISALSVNQGFATYSTAGKSASTDPAVYAAQKLGELLQARGVTVAEPPRSGVVPDDTAAIAELSSLPMRDIVTEMLTESDNTTAEILVKNLGVEVFEKGTTADGVRALLGNLQEAGLPLGGVQLVDGSGLDRSNRVTCSAVSAVLLRDGADGVIAKGLARAGETGTLSTRLNNTVAVGHLQAKTGTLAGVSALAGWARPEAQQPFNFVVITNGLAGQASRALEDQLAVMLASQPKTAPSADAFAPEGLQR